MRESEVQAAFVRHLEGAGWTVTVNDPSHIDVIAVRGDERLVAEVKGRTSEPGLDVDTAFGQLLRRIDPDCGDARYLIVVPTSVKSAVVRVAAEVRARLGIEVVLVADDGRVSWLSP